MKLYRALVENNLDPEEIGRVQVRIYGIHSFEESRGLEGSDTSGLPWAEVIGGTEFGLIQGIGASSILRNGTLVWILFEEDDTNKPLVIGVIKGKINGVSDINKGRPDSEYGKVAIIKSESGSSLDFDDTPGKERVTLIDKFGSFIEMTLEKILTKVIGNKVDEITKNYFMNTAGATRINSGNGLEIKNDTLIDGNLYVKGTITSTGNIQSEADVISSTGTLDTMISVHDSHNHTGNMGAPTSPPILGYLPPPGPAPEEPEITDL